MSLNEIVDNLVEMIVDQDTELFYEMLALAASKQ